MVTRIHSVPEPIIHYSTTSNGISSIQNAKNGSNHTDDYPQRNNNILFRKTGLFHPMFKLKDRGLLYGLGKAGTPQARLSSSSPLKWSKKTFFCIFVAAAIMTTLNTNTTSTTMNSSRDSMFPSSSSSVMVTTTSCSDYDHGTNQRQPNEIDNTIQSIFNCGSPYGKCTWYYPNRFMNHQCGIGREFTYLLEQARILKENHHLWNKMPPILMPSISMTIIDEKKEEIDGNNNESDGSEEQQYHSPQQQYNLTLVHVHKTGGTSLIVAMGKLANSNNNRNQTENQQYNTNFYDAKVKNYIVYGGDFSTKANQQYSSEVNDLLDGATHYPYPSLFARNPSTIIAPSDEDVQDQEQQEEQHRQQQQQQQEQSQSQEPRPRPQHTIFAVVRDPAERFISAIGQAVGGHGSIRRRGVDKELRKDCVTPYSNDNKNGGQIMNDDEKRREILRCFVNLVKDYDGDSGDGDIEDDETKRSSSTSAFSGTWIELHFAPMILDISFATMNKDVPVAIFPFKELPTLLEHFGADPKKKVKDGKETRKFKNSDLIDSMSFADYDEDSLKDLCQVYRMDVLLMNYLGYETSCDRFFQK